MIQQLFTSKPDEQRTKALYLSHGHVMIRLEQKHILQSLHVNTELVDGCLWYYTRCIYYLFWI